MSRDLASRLRTLARRAAAGLLLLAALASGGASGGCNILGFAAQAVGGDDKTKNVKVDAEYPKLAGKSVAVIVAADEDTLYQNPAAQLQIGRAVSRQIAADIKTVRIADPNQVNDFQRANPYWSTFSNKAILEALKVERLVYIDVAQFSTHEPGNSYEWRGMLVARVKVAEAEAANPSDFAYAQDVAARFPPDKPVGVLDSDDATIRAGLLGDFAQRVSWLFYNHEETVPK
jgi:hypothetical protein